MSKYLDLNFTVDSRAVDMFGQCRPSALLGYLQEAATLAGLELGVSGPLIYEKYHCQWLVTRMWVEMSKPLHWNESFAVRTWHRGATGASVYRDFDLTQNGRPIGQGVSIWVMADADNRKLFRMKDLMEFQGTDGGELRKSVKLRRVALPESFDGRESRSMRYSETDINGHINNIHYADFACDALHLERRAPGQFVRSLQIGYLDECRAGETIQIDTAVRDNRWYARGQGPTGGERFEFLMDLEKEPMPLERH